MTAIRPVTHRLLRLALLILTHAPDNATAGTQPGVVINEINYAPRFVGTDPVFYEYVELFARTTTDISGWHLQNLSAANVRTDLFQFPSMIMPAGSWLVILQGVAAGEVPEDTDFFDRKGLLIAPLWTGANALANSGDAVELYDSANTTLQDFVYYDEINVGDPAVDDEAVAEGIWKDGAAIDVLSSSTTGRAIALKVDGQSPNEVNPVADAEDQDWMQYSLGIGGTPGARNAVPPLGVLPRETPAAGFRGIRPSPAQSGQASFQFTLAAPGRVGFEIQDIAGRIVSSVPPASFGAGPAEVAWKSTQSETGQVLPAGVYIVRMIIDGQTRGTHKLTILR